MQSSSAPSSQSVSLKAGSTQSLPPSPFRLLLCTPGPPLQERFEPRAPVPDRPCPPPPLQRRPAWFLSLCPGGFRVARPPGAGPAPDPLRPRPPRLDWSRAPLPGLLPAPSVRGHRHLVQRVPRGDLEAPLEPGAHCGAAEGARAREEERRCRTELRQEQETYGRAEAATAARGHRGVPSSGLAAARQAEPFGLLGPHFSELTVARSGDSGDGHRSVKQHV